MKKLLASVLTALMFCFIGAADPQYNNNQTDIDLISYIETHEVDSYEEFVDIIQTVSPESVDEETDSIESFSIDIDYDNKIISVTTIGEASYDRLNGASNSASRSYYSSSGAKIFTIKVSGTFGYTTGSCTTISASGSFTRASGSTWTSTPTISSGNITVRKAYARISGTATSGASSISYSLTLTCDDSGNFGSY